MTSNADNLAQTAQWKAHPLPYCVSTFQVGAGGYAPRGRRRYATADEALAVAVKLGSPRGYMAFADFADSFKRVSA